MALTMTKSRTKLICMLTVMFLSLLWNAVNATSLTTLRQRIFHNLSVQSQERVYLSFNNTRYTSGEGVYFSADIVSDPNGSATNLSSVLYVELLAPSGWIVDRQKLKIVDGRANGAFQLAENISSGLYEIRAYTAWMLNYTNVDATEQTIDVSQPNSTTVSYTHLMILPTFKCNLSCWYCIQEHNGADMSDDTVIKVKKHLSLIHI